MPKRKSNAFTRPPSNGQIGAAVWLHTHATRGPNRPSHIGGHALIVTAVAGHRVANPQRLRMIAVLHDLIADHHNIIYFK